MATKATKDLKKKVSQKGRKTNSKVNKIVKKSTTKSVNNKKTSKKVNRPVIKEVVPIKSVKKVEKSPIIKKEIPKKVNKPVKENKLEDRILDSLFNYKKKPEDKKKKKVIKKEISKKEEIKIRPKKEDKVYGSKDVSILELPRINETKLNTQNKSLIRILGLVFVCAIIVSGIIFINLNHFGDSNSVKKDSNLKVSYEISQKDESNKVTITLHASSNRGLKRVLLPSQKVEFLSSDTSSDIKYLVSSNGTYTFSISDNANKVEKVDIVVDTF